MNSRFGWMSLSSMNEYGHTKPALCGLIVICSLLGLLVFSSTTVLASSPSTDNRRTYLNSGYSALKIFLQDEQYLTIIRRTKAVLMFEGISESSKRIIDAISDTSATALEQLEYIASAKPPIRLKVFSEDSIAMTTLDAMRMTTAKELIFNSDDFEKSLLLSQAQILRVISHLLREIEQQEPNLKRKDWLGKLADRYEGYYREVYARISVAKPAGG
jgi:hypothetical protein